MNTEKLVIARVFGKAWMPRPNDRRGPPWANPNQGDYFTVDTDQYRDRIPHLGKMDVSKQETVDAIVEECHEGRIDALDFCQYVDGPNKRVEYDDMLQRLKTSTLAANLRHMVSFEPKGSFQPFDDDALGALDAAIAANDAPAIARLRNQRLNRFKKLVDDWSREFKHERYLHINDAQPAVGILHAEYFAEDCAVKLGKTVTELLDLAREMADRDIYFVANVEFSGHWVNHVETVPYNAISAYNHMRGWADRANNVPGPAAKSIDELTQIYVDAMAYLESRPFKKDIWIPAHAGFDAGPVGEGVVGYATKAQFEMELRLLKAFLMRMPNARAINIDALDEIFEGSILLSNPQHGRSRWGIVRRILKGLRW